MKTCLILSDDPTARRKLRLILDELGLDNLEAAGKEQAQKCLEQSPDAIFVVADQLETFADLINMLPLRNSNTPRRPAKILFETPEGGTGRVYPVNHSLRLEDADKETVGFALVDCRVIDSSKK